jgi:hypothetical protein
MKVSRQTQGPVVRPDRVGVAMQQFVRQAAFEEHVRLAGIEAR